MNSTRWWWWAAVLAMVVVPGACADEAPSGPALEGAAEGQPCSGSTPCATGLVCQDAVCAAEDGGPANNDDSNNSNNSNNTSTNNGAGDCFDGRDFCGARCCREGFVCVDGGCEQDCGGGVICGDVCCDAGQVCDGGQCLSACEGTRCGPSLELCCGAGEVCFAEACVEPSGPCTRDEECAADELCEESLGQCLPRSGVATCEFVPPVGEFEPSLGCRWTPEGLMVTPERGDIVATPVIGNLTDDNGDGLTNTDDVPDIAFLSYDLSQACCNIDATLRIVHGECNPDGTMRTLASLDFPGMDNSAGLALGDLDGDGVPELVAVGMYGPVGNNGRARPQGALAWKRVADNGTRWTVMWENMEHPTWDVHTRGGALVSIADLHGDGLPEVIIGNVVLNGQTGGLLWDGVVTSGGAGGMGNNAFLGPSSTVADIDLDGSPEILAGNTAYSRDGAVLWTFPYESENSPCGGSLPCDGYSAVANFDDDDEAEVVIVRQGEVFILEHSGELLWKQAIPLDDCANNESGPPTIADFDGDGAPEIGTAAADFYVVLDPACEADTPGCDGPGVLWKSPNEDCSSRVTASSVFDFEGDGKAEMIYADETNFRIYDGTTGRVLFDDDTHGSHTRIEMPVVVDVDNDGNSEVIIPENGSRSGTPGLEVWEDGSDNWVRTRRIWNQHNYHVTNVNEDGTIPRQQEPNWLNARLNNFRQNIQPDGLFDAPNLTVRAIAVDASRCNSTFEVEIAVTVANEGALSVAPGAGVLVEAIGEAGVFTVANLATLTRLLPGQIERLVFTWSVPMELWGEELRLKVAIDPTGAVNECEEDDNILEQEAEASFSCNVIE